MEADVEVDVAEVSAVSDAGDRGEGRAEDERRRTMIAVGVDAHQPGGVGVLGGGPHRPADPGAVDEAVRAGQRRPPATTTMSRSPASLDR